ncbi:DUF5007 domain-containing protein [Chitinophaga niabensis]|uniref:DUF5007 domain-containing protein n=1 Tax=Chitinophaga niabensis TaxID=536979 RepID=A0A1N6D842_9BACT|nr:DUF5007 domain-containing protein [Chitinophaga niabensis]SIN66982.1 protein of unknown function [Chitinophaga niabensis]
MTTSYKNIAKAVMLVALTGGVIYSCRKVDMQDGYFGENIRYKDKIITLETGRDAYKGDLILDRSTLPIKVELADIRRWDGKPAPEMKQEVDAVEWVEEFTGQEKTLEELEKKKRIVKRPVFEISPSDGRLKFRKESYEMDSATYFIDVKVSNGAGSRIIKNALEVKVVKGADYESRDDGAWIVCSDYDWDGCSPYFDSINIRIDKFEYKGPGNKITVKFKDPNGNLMDPRTFPEGSKQKGKRMQDFVFAQRLLADRIEYDVAYPFNTADRQFEWWVPGAAFGKNDHYDLFAYVNFKVFRPGSWEITWQAFYP